MKAFSLLSRAAPSHKILLGSILLFPSALYLHKKSPSLSLLKRHFSSFFPAACLGTASHSFNFQEMRDTLYNSWKGFLATEIARVRVASGRHGQSEKVKEILDRDKNVVDLIKESSAPARIIVIPKDFQEEGFVAAFASNETANQDAKKVVIFHTQNTVMDPELVPSFLRYLSEQEFQASSFLFIIDAQGVIDAQNTNCFSNMNELASLFKDKANLKTFIFTSLKDHLGPAAPGTARIDLYSYFRQQAEHYARTQIDSHTTISHFIAQKKLDSCNKVFRLTHQLQKPPRIYSNNSILQELASCFVDSAKGIWALLKLSFYILFGLFLLTLTVVQKSAKKEEKPDKVDELLEDKNRGYIIRDYRGEEACPICLEQIKLIAFMTACKHMYHLECIRDWVKRNSSCPLCRKPVTFPKQINRAA